MSSSDCSHCVPSRFSVVLSASVVLYSQCAATPDSATTCMACVRSWNSTFTPEGPTTVVCSDW